MKLKRTLGLPMLTFYGVGMILGAGIYTIIGKATGVAGESVWISLIIAGLTALLAALSYAECASMFPQIGGEYVYLEEAFPNAQWAVNTCGLMMVFVGILTASTLALSFSGYLQHFIDLPIILIGFSVIAIFTIVNIRGIKESSWANLIFTCIELLGLLIFIYFGMTSKKFGEAILVQPTFKVFTASSFIIFAYFGFENLVNLSEETKHPKKMIPKAIILSLLLSTLLYVLVALSAVSLLSPEKLQMSSAPLSDALKMVSSKSATILAAIALFATANTILISLVVTSRLVYSLSRKKKLPKFFMNLSLKRKTPWGSAIFVGSTATLLLFFKSLELLAKLSSLITIMAFIVVHVSLIVLRTTKPNLKREFKIHLSVGKIPIFPVLGIGSAIFLLSQFQVLEYLLVGLLFIVLFFYQFVRSKNIF